jgi:8-oxo-dGTP diphosphatase
MKKFKNKPNNCIEKDGNQYWISRSIAVCGTISIIVDDDIYILAGKRGKNSADNIGKWNLICGYLDFNETVQEACEREIWEETGFDLNILESKVIDFDKPWRIYSEPNGEKQNVTLHFTIISYMDYFPKLTLKYNEVEDETEEAKWINIKDINNYQWAFDHMNVIKEYENKFLTYFK